MAESNKTEQATPRRRLKAREQGQVTRSRDLSSVLAMLAVVGVTILMARQGAGHWIAFFRSTLDSAATDSIQPNGPLLFWTSVEVLRWVVPILLSALVVSLAVSLAQGGFVFAPEALSLKFERLSPASRLKQMFSLTALSTVLKSLLPFSAILWVGTQCVRSHWGAILLSSYIGPRVLASLVGSMILEVGWKSSLILLVWAAVDYLLQWFKSEGDLKMSRQEIREEMKESDGNPASKARMRRIQRQSRRRQMIQAAETATVVVTNPTHYAVALRFELHMDAPVVVAKGLDLLAEKIKEIARERDIPLMENRALAQALYRSVEVGDAIPAALYNAVAEILVLIFRTQAEIRNREAQRRAAASATGPARPQ
jgi:flagellar biosynthetic protein FlhB